MSGIGTLNEKPLHAALKKWYSKPTDQSELTVDGFIIDIVRDDLLLEIQTGNFSSIKSKLQRLVGSHKVRLIYPIAQEKWIVKLPKEEGGKVSRRKSPRKGRIEDLFWEMVSFPQLLAHPNFSLDVLVIKEEEVRRHSGKRSWRRKGWTIEERRLLEVVEQRLFQEPSDLRILLPKDLATFTARELSDAAEISHPLAQKMVYCLRHASVINLMGKRGRANMYGVVAT